MRRRISQQTYIVSNCARAILSSLCHRRPALRLTAKRYFGPACCLFPALLPPPVPHPLICVQPRLQLFPRLDSSAREALFNMATQQGARASKEPEGLQFFLLTMATVHSAAQVQHVASHFCPATWKAWRGSKQRGVGMIVCILRLFRDVNRENT